MAYLDYQLVARDSSEELSRAIQTYLSEGWQPYAPPVCIHLDQTNKKFQLVQAVVKGTPDGGANTGPITSTDITDATVTGIGLLTSADQTAARAAIGAGTSSFSGSYAELTNKPSIPAAPANGDADKLQAGTDSTQTLWSAKMIHDEIRRQLEAIP